ADEVADLPVDHLPAHPDRPTWRRYAIALLSVLLASLAEMLIAPLVGEDVAPFLISPFAVIASAWLGGLGPGILSTILCVLVEIYFFLPPSYSLAVERHDAYQLGTFLIAGIAISLFTLARDRARRALLRADVRSADALRRWEYVFNHAGWGIVLVSPQFSIRA